MNTTEIGDEFEKRVFNALSIFINTEESYLNGQRSVLIHKYKSTKEENGYIRDIDVDIMIKTYKTAEDKEKSKYDKSIIPEFMTVVECKAYKEKIHVNILEELHTRILYGNFVRGILVSKNGFSETAIKFAKIYNIGLYIVNENDAVETIVKRKEKSLNDIVFNSLVNLLYYFDIIEKYSFNYSKVKIGFI